MHDLWPEVWLGKGFLVGRQSRTLTKCKCIYPGIRTRSGSRWVSISSINSSSNNSVGTGIPMKSIVHTERSNKTGSILNSSIPSSERGAGTKSRAEFSLSGTPARGREGASETGGAPKGLARTVADFKAGAASWAESRQGDDLGRMLLL